MRGRAGQPVGAGLAAVWLVAFVAADVATPGQTIVLSPLFAIAPLIACAVLPPRWTAAFAAAAIGLVVASGAWNHTWATGQEHVRTAEATVVAVAAVVVSVVRVRRERSYARVAAIGAIAQRAVLPTLPKQAGPVRLASRYVSATEDALVGGDFYDYYRSESCVRLVIGDVRGKGLGAMEHAARVIRAFRQSAAAAPDLAAVAKEMDEYLKPFFGDEDFATALLVHVADEHTLTFADCGHDAPLFRTVRGVETVPCPPGLPLGLGPSYDGCEMTWHVGDRLLLYTDGLVEARNRRGEFLTIDAIAACLDRPTLDDALDAILATVTEHAGGRLNDDLALVLVENIGDRRPG